MAPQDTNSVPSHDSEARIVIPPECREHVLAPTSWARLLIDNCIEPRASEQLGNVLDLGTGSGVLAIALATRGFKHITACDVNHQAVRVASANVASNGFANHVTVCYSNMFSELQPRLGSYKLIVANPPTLPIVPHALLQTDIDSAFFAAHHGRGFIDETIDGAAHFLAPGGRLILLHPSYHDMSITTRRISAAALNLTHTLYEEVLSFRPFAGVLRNYGYSLEPILAAVAALSRSGDYTFFTRSNEDRGTWFYRLTVLEITKPR